MLMAALAGGCAATPRPPAPRAAQAPLPPVKHVAAARQLPAKSAKVCVPAAPILTDAQRDELFRQFDQEQAKRAGQ